MPAERQLSLLAPAPRPEWVERLRDGLRSWGERGICFGTSSWKYEGWLGQIYTSERYVARGRFSRKQFEQHCLEEYAEIFPSVCCDFSFYQFYSDDFWRGLFAQVPRSFRFGFKVPEVITCPVSPEHARYGKLAGQRNESFLDADVLKREFLDRLVPYVAQVGYIVLEFPEFAGKKTGGCDEFLDKLDRFLPTLPHTFRYGVELRTRRLLGDEYFRCLRAHNVAHVFNAWTRMPTIGEQLALPDAFTSDLVISRVLLRPGRSYEEAVRAFEPYAEIRDPNTEGYKDVANLVRATVARSRKAQAFIAINNRFTGNAPQTISEILKELGQSPSP